MRTTSTPARIIFSKTFWSLEAGPRVATILVLRNINIFALFILQRAALKSLPLVIFFLREIPKMLRHL